MFDVVAWWNHGTRMSIFHIKATARVPMRLGPCAEDAEARVAKELIPVWPNQKAKIDYNPKLKLSSLLPIETKSIDWRWWCEIAGGQVTGDHIVEATRVSVEARCRPGRRQCWGGVCE
ncbi:hypothetical protein L6452_02208 [Arctium lappa]|uniref:Uncharacterized protein n=1 Tax=Arctium lappa TaxID=4217 RepID=A0ACB9FJR5_ARCLA|nr:hypothetical protein L6452_02208 [Arctium lappa]